MITSFTAFLFNILANLSRRILKAELSKLTHEEHTLKSELGRAVEENSRLRDENSKLIKAGLELSMSYRKLEITTSALTTERDELKAKLEHSSASITSLMDQRRTQNNALDAIRNALNYLDRQQQPGTQAQQQPQQEPKSWSPKTAPKPVAVENDPPSHLADILDRLYPTQQSTQS